MPRASLKSLLSQGKIVVAPGTHDALGAKIIEKAGFSAVYMTGNGLSASLIGAPDLGLLTMSEMIERGRAFVSAVNVPVIADADTGYGNANNVVRTIREYEAAGVSAVHLEDQVTPKRCGAMKGLALVTPEEHAEKIRAAVSARSNPEMLIIGRTDSRIPLGFEEAIKRGQLYAEAGADLVLIEMLQNEEEIKEAVRSIKAPLMFNAVDGKTPPLTVEQFEALGIKLLAYPLSSTLVYARIMQDFTAHLKKTGTLQGFDKPGIAIPDYEAILDRSNYA